MTVPGPSEYSRIVQCTHCNPGQVRELLRDTGENIPQPGYVGAHYEERRVLLVGQNPSVGHASRAKKDAMYLATLRHLAEEPSEQFLLAFMKALRAVLPGWPLHGRHFPLEECGLTLDQIAYCNVVRCRTQRNATPSRRLSETCIERHFCRWLELLDPSVVVFLGKWASDRARWAVEERQIPHAFINRDRSLSREQRAENRSQVADLVRRATAGVAECPPGTSS